MFISNNQSALRYLAFCYMTYLCNPTSFLFLEISPQNHSHCLCDPSKFPVLASHMTACISGQFAFYFWMGSHNLFVWSIEFPFLVNSKIAYVIRQEFPFLASRSQLGLKVMLVSRKWGNPSCWPSPPNGLIRWPELGRMSQRGGVGWRVLLLGWDPLGLWNLQGP